MADHVWERSRVFLIRQTCILSRIASFHNFLRVCQAVAVRVIAERISVECVLFAVREPITIQIDIGIGGSGSRQIVLSLPFIG